tara:strand:+ start:8637 stop:9515 length:879 start_codon:yes stop_codon:yes gene_type:complete
VKKIFAKLFKTKNLQSDNGYRLHIEPKIKEYVKIIKEKKEISFLHYGHLGDIINSLPIIKEISKSKKCSLFIEKDKKIPDHVLKDHPFGKFFLSEKSISKLLPLLKNQRYLSNVEIYNRENIDIDLNFFRELPINFNTDSVRWYFHLTGIFPDLSNSYLDVENNNNFKKKIVIMRSLRRQNKNIDYSFLNNYDDLLFVGLKEEYDILKQNLSKMEFHDSKDFLELASIIKNARIFIGNLSFGYALAEAVKVPRLLESRPNFPLVYPNGENAYDFYFQDHFELHFKKIYYKTK